eukprot:gnl/Chilomastix_caulleri/6292.p1 GENE.gnl/Chilomastix_caulleri/6292~~gnl/Chilomastix_caulleri/6292.p1  ORF type:complete len:72 (-),score=15.24 gnl/Chilomastix_caulleri/6292:102-317(-)
MISSVNPCEQEKHNFKHLTFPEGVTPMFSNSCLSPFPKTRGTYHFTTSPAMMSSPCCVELLLTHMTLLSLL